MQLDDVKEMLLLPAFLLFPKSHMRSHRHGMIAECDCLCDCMPTDVSSAGYKYLASRMKKEEEDPNAEQEAQDKFLLQLDELERLLSKHAGPYLVGWVQFPSLLAPAVTVGDAAAWLQPDPTPSPPFTPSPPPPPLPPPAPFSLMHRSCSAQHAQFC